MTRFYEHLRAVDVVVNLRYPSAGESSGTMARAMAEGLPTIVNNYASFAEVPRDVALKVEIDGDQGAQVAAHLLHLAEDADFRARIGRNAGRYAREELDPIRCRDRYVAFAEEVAGRAGADLARR
jgi:glycosyltransferase involved in cell wall biosynthesis